MIDPNEQQPHITPEHREAWEKDVARVDEAMKKYTKPFVTPISRVMKDEQGEYGELHGTGTYVQIVGGKYLLTNEHVAAAVEQNSLGHQFFGCDNVFRATNPFLSFSAPLDVAVSAIEQAVWVHSQHNAAAIPEDRWALVHGTPKGEILFFKGYAGALSRFHFDHLIANATSYASQEVALPNDDDRLDARLHFAIDYRPDRAKTLEANGPGLPDPHGFSGSLVWNTRFVEAKAAGKEWGPHCAVVTGLVWGWPPSKHGCLVATRVEFVRSFLLRAIQP